MPPTSARSPRRAGWRLPWSRAIPPLALAASALALSACLSDGPNRVAGDYLRAQGILLQGRLYTVSLDGVPVDSVWTVDADTTHLSQGEMLVGGWGPFQAYSRLGFEITDTAFLDSLSADSTLKLSLGLKRYASTGKEYVDANLARQPDPMRVEVRSWVKADSDYGHWNDTTNRYKNLFIGSSSRFFIPPHDTSGLLAGLGLAAAVDTIVLRPPQALASPPDTIQANRLPHLRELLRQSRLGDRNGHDNRWLVLQELAALDAAARPGPLRLVGVNNGANSQAYLLFGHVDSAAQATQDRQRLAYKYFDRRVTYAGDRAGTLTFGQPRALRFRLNRDTVMARIGQALRDSGLPFSEATAGDFDANYFVPLARITLPMAGGSAEFADPALGQAAFPYMLDFRLDSDLDSLPAGPADSAPRPVTLHLATHADGSLDSSAVLYVRDRFQAGSIVDSLRIKARRSPLDAGTRQVIFAFADSASRNDTLSLPAGGHLDQTVTFGLPTAYYQTINFAVGDSAVDLTFLYLVNPGVGREAVTVRDPQSGTVLSDYKTLAPRLFRIGDSALTLRATLGLQSLLNRRDPAGSLLHDFQVNPYRVVDTTAARFAEIPFPTLATVPVLAPGGKLTVGLTIYLYPLGLKANP